MKISLRKAAIVQDILHAEVKSLKCIKADTFVTIFETNISEQIKDHAEFVAEVQAKIEKYMTIRAILRTLVAEYNVQAGVHKLLSEDAILSSQEIYYENFLEDIQPKLSNQALERHLESIMNTESTSRYIQLHTLTSSEIKAIRAKLDAVIRRKRQIKEKLLKLNVNTLLEVPSEVASLMCELGLD